MDAEPNQVEMSRRKLLRLLGLSAVGVGAVVVARGIAGQTFGAPPSNSARSTSTSSATSVAAPAGSQGLEPLSEQVRVKVMYFQMPLAVDIDKEYFVLNSPASYGDLLPAVLKEHPALTRMMPTMMVLVDGVSAQPRTALRDGDEIDLIPAGPGG